MTESGAEVKTVRIFPVDQRYVKLAGQFSYVNFLRLMIEPLFRKRIQVLPEVPRQRPVRSGRGRKPDVVLLTVDPDLLVRHGPQESSSVSAIGNGYFHHLPDVLETEPQDFETVVCIEKHTGRGRDRLSVSGEGTRSVLEHVELPAIRESQTGAALGSASGIRGHGKATAGGGGLRAKGGAKPPVKRKRT